MCDYLLPEGGLALAFTPPKGTPSPNWGKQSTSWRAGLSTSWRAGFFDDLQVGGLVFFSVDLQVGRTVGGLVFFFITRLTQALYKSHPQPLKSAP